MAVSSVSQALTITDNYIGQANGTLGSNVNTQDATSADFDITSMDYSNDGTSVTFTLHSFEDPTFGSYFDDWANDDTNFAPGDLFLSTNGWTPFDDGSAGFGNDGFEYDPFGPIDGYEYNGTAWDYVINLEGLSSSRTNGNAAGKISGSTELYSLAQNPDGTLIDGGGILEGSIRTRQEAFYDPTSGCFDCDFDNTNPLGGGSWNVFDADNNGIDDSMSITMLLSAGFQDVLDEAAVNAANNGISIEEAVGFHWTMACSNDVIEGAFPAPIPAAVWLFGSGLLGLVGIARRRNIA
jgi:hypothetical protein